MNIRQVYLMFFFIANMSIAAEEPVNTNKWQLGVTFGEIPILSGSFKPGITAGYYFSKYFSLEVTIQLKDFLQRDGESFNATSIGLNGLESSRETTGERIFLGIRYKPVDWSPYLTIGLVWNNADTESMTFSSSDQIIGNNHYSGDIKIEQTRVSGFAPAFGFGYQYDFKNGISLNTNFAMAFLSDIVSPKIELESQEEIEPNDLIELEKHMDEKYKSNFHNRYHIFNLGIIYRFK